MEIALRSYRRGKSWTGQLGEWPAWYLHERNRDMQEIWRDPDTGEMRTMLLANPPQSSLSIGQWGVWEMEVTGEAGEFANGALPPSMLPVQAAAVDSPAPLLEGAGRILELTHYERNPVARRLCLAHYGCRCQACGMSYEERYGAIGADLIHVHHVIPLAARDGEHEVDPIRDLVPLCANCHHVVHCRNPPYSVKEVRRAFMMRAGNLHHQSLLTLSGRHDGSGDQ
ncbi:HNH endonuclease (plasmid) [Rhizobium binae]|nr:HNH endonuclease [Rhizobium binae]